MLAGRLSDKMDLAGAEVKLLTPPPPPPSPPPCRTNWTRLVPPPVLIGQVKLLTGTVFALKTDPQAKPRPTAPPPPYCCLYPCPYGTRP